MFKIRKKIFVIFSQKEKKQYIGLFFLSVIGAFLDMLGVSLTMPLVYSLIGVNDGGIFKKTLLDIFPNINSNQYLIMVILSMVAIYIFKNLFLSFEYYAQSSFTNKCKKRVRKQLYDSFLFRPYEEFLKCTSGEIINKLTSDCDGVFSLIHRYLLMRTEITVSVVIFTYLLILDYKMMTVLAIILVIELAVISRIIEPIIKKASGDNYKFVVKANTWINQTFDGIKEVKVSSKIDYFSNKFNEYSAGVSNTITKYDFLSSLPRNIIEAVTMSCVLLYILFYIKLGNEVNELIPHLSAFAIAAVRLLPSFNRISNARNAIAYYEKKLDSIVEQLNEKKPLYSNDQNDEPISLNDSLEMRDISFCYSNRNNMVIENGQLEIKYGSFVGIIGSSGAGKTTLVDILLGLLKPQKGIVLSDGKNISVCYKSWISNIGYIPQNIFIINSTIKENIGFGLIKEDIDEDRVVDALKKAQLYEFVKSLPDGLDTIIGERGIGLSGGQKQRIGIARALYSDPQILIFDEATSSLDIETEKEIMESISQFHNKKTLIIISHHSSTIENCDVVYHIRNKKIYREK